MPKHDHFDPERNDEGNAALVGRRSLMTTAGLGLGLGLASTFSASKPAEAQQADGEIWSREYWASKGDVKLYCFRKRVGAPQAGERARPVVIMVHGSSMSARATYDLTVPGAGDYSIMNALARGGFDVWSVDHENYGRSSRTASNSDVASGAADLEAVAKLDAAETGQTKFSFVGESSGGLRAGVLAMRRPELIDKLVLLAFTYTGAGSPTLAKRGEQTEFYRTHNRRPRDRDMIRSIFTRDKEGTSDMRVAEALADAELQFGDEVPTGTYLDMTANMPVVHPEKVQAPVLMITGEYDGNSTLDDSLEFFKRLPNGDRQFIILKNTAHSTTLSLNRKQVWHATIAFLSEPEDATSLKRG
jgi:pimeloyl-ACP methyl ester carboxylesterase